MFGTKMTPFDPHKNELNDTVFGMKNAKPFKKNLKKEVSQNQWHALYYANQEDFDAFMQMWNVLVSSSTKKDFKDQLANFVVSLSEKSEALKYVMTTWLVYKKQFVKAWTLEHPHFGNKSSSRTEGAHAYVKKFLQFSKGDLLLVFNKLNTALDHQIKGEVSQINMEKMHHSVKIPEYFCTGIRKNFFVRLKEMSLQHGKLKQELCPCTGIFTLDMGIPWTHKLAAIMRNRGTLTAYNFHPQWQMEWNSTNGERRNFGGQWELIRARIEMLPETKQEKAISDIEKVLDGRSTTVQLKPPLVNFQSRGRLFGAKNLPKTV
uniref:Pc21g00130 putative n=1 Tax=Albugo laibachii Nc14 TaxID=890382 RepID=F0WMD9_9STRA|nr:Pc21g00130 putative [Albugo laibachii Nc14]|eukprot:CCA22470.1 Pc21g00130 putative [Albugo laibachii Nc14]